MVRILHVISGLGVGGAETTLYRTLSAKGMDSARHRVVSLTPGGAMASRVCELGIEVTELDFRGPAKALRGLVRLWRLIRSEHPDVVQTWMYHADLLGGMAARLAGVSPVYWNVRHFDLSWGANRLSTLLIARLCAWSSGWIPDRIVTCADAALKSHVKIGYRADAFELIPNGVSLDDFAPDPESYRDVRVELGLPQNARCVGLFGRLHPQKDHENFLRAAAILSRKRDDVYFLLCGAGVEKGNRELDRLITMPDDRLRLLGMRRDVPRLAAALNLGVLASVGEAFPNVVAEFMASGVPCVVTDVGDAGLIVGTTGKIVPPRDPEALAQAMEEVLGLDDRSWKDLSERARQRVAENFSLDVSTSRYKSFWGMSQ